jgi:hypothetical protein
VSTKKEQEPEGGIPTPAPTAVLTESERSEPARSEARRGRTISHIFAQQKGESRVFTVKTGRKGGVSAAKLEVAGQLLDHFKTL